jgi:CubicO group peptidase (beta-lactamase class C family)
VEEVGELEEPEKDDRGPTIEGFVDPAFAPVRREFERNFRSRGEVGAAVAVYVDGRLVVDLWGGVTDKRRRTPWRRETLQMVFSATKGATALCAHLLAARGRIDLAAPVARIWPEFARAGKEGITIEMVLSHRAGLAAVDEELPVEAAYDWERMVGALERTSPNWPPDTAHGYHPFTFGWLVGEVVRRSTGRSLGRFFREEIAGPLGLEFWIGLPEELDDRVATVHPGPLPETPNRFARALSTRGTLTARAFLNPRTFFASGHTNSRRMRAAEIPAANGIATARGLAGLYVPLACGGKWKGIEWSGPAGIARMAQVRSDGEDLVLLQRTRFSLGFMKSVDDPDGDRAVFGPNPAAFGHVGAGGSLGMADPEARVAIGYVMNQMGQGVLLNERGQSLVDAVYESLG